MKYYARVALHIPFDKFLQMDLLACQIRSVM